MARDEQPREDLLAEATGLVERIRLRLRTPRLAGEETVAGFRRDDSLAIFFGQQRVYQFTSAGALRRAFVADVLYKAQAGALVAMRRERTEHVVHLVSRQLDPDATASFLRTAHECLREFEKALREGAYTPLGQVPAEADIAGRVLAWLGLHGEQISIAASPRSA